MMNRDDNLWEHLCLLMAATLGTSRFEIPDFVNNKYTRFI